MLDVVLVGAQLKLEDLLALVITPLGFGVKVVLVTFVVWRECLATCPGS